jgi:hypothetical protein
MGMVHIDRTSALQSLRRPGSTDTPATLMKPTHPAFKNLTAFLPTKDRGEDNRERYNLRMIRNHLNGLLAGTRFMNIHI